MKPWKRQIELFVATKLASITFPNRYLSTRKIVSRICTKYEHCITAIYLNILLHLRAKYDNIEDIKVVMIRERSLTGNLINKTIEKLLRFWLKPCDFSSCTTTSSAIQGQKNFGDT
jgi:hypothetical protein